ncbi:hypothetical protein [Pontibacter sp. G13]|uniref:hypothetical protein n=1 Tax=Pontibacter sp. G13 TaxID=3074898 RepID=UPI0028897F90|nr:hypothetical protein [Pontibacter sp. G13]WNJ16853.1 hypothetical protein RJD25_18470 [Pontibacter sp. G13]
MNPRTPLLRSLLIGMVIMAISSCQLITDPNKIILPEWDPIIAIPIMHDSLGIFQIGTRVDSSVRLRADADGLLSLVYQDTFTSGYLEEFVHIEDFEVLAPPVGATVPFPDDRFGNMSIRRMVLEVEYRQDIDEAMEFTFFVGSLTKNDIPYSETIVEAETGTVRRTYTITDYEFSLPGGRIFFQYRAKRISTGEELTIQPIVLRFSEIDLSYVEGKMGAYRVALETQRIDLDMFQRIQPVGIKMLEPRINCRVRNTFGLPLLIKSQLIQARTLDGDSIDLNSARLESGIPLNFPALEAAGDARTTLFEINRNNSNLPELINAGTSSMLWRFVGEIADSDQDTYGFVLDSSRVDIEMEIDLPLYGSFESITLDEEFEMDLSGFEDLWQEAELRIVAENQYPIDLELQIYLLDANFQQIDSLFTDVRTILKAAEVTEEGKPIIASTKVTDLPISPKRIQNFELTRAIKVVAKVATNEGGTIPIQVLERNYLNVSMGLEIDR